MEIHISEGKITKIKWKKYRSKPELTEKDLKLAKELVEAKKEEIIKKWINYFILNKTNIKPIKITKKIK